VLVPYLDGERTPNRPDSSGALHGLTHANTTPAHLARAAVEGMLCALADGLDALVSQAVTPQRVILIGGGAQSEAVRQLAPAIFGCPVIVPEPAEYVADGAARQAAWVLSGHQDPPDWAGPPGKTYESDDIDLQTRERYREASEHFVSRAPEN
jgi:xylulokinase